MGYDVSTTHVLRFCFSNFGSLHEIVRTGELCPPSHIMNEIGVPYSLDVGYWINEVILIQG